MDNRPLLIVDLEATCWENRTTPTGKPQNSENMEINEFGCALANRNGKLLDSQSFLVMINGKPRAKRILYIANQHYPIYD